MIKFILGMIAAFGILFFISSPAGKTAVAVCAAKLQAVASTAPATALPALDDEELQAPPISGEEEPAAGNAAPKAASPAAAEAGTEDTFAAVMEVYEKAGREQASKEDATE